MVAIVSGRGGEDDSPQGEAPPRGGLTGGTAGFGHLHDIMAKENRLP
jgi:hypothetical protein